MNNEDRNNTVDTQNNQQVIEELRVSNLRSLLGKKLLWSLAEGSLLLIIIFSLVSYIARDFAFSAPVISACVIGVFALIGLSGSVGQIALVQIARCSQNFDEIQQKMREVPKHKLLIRKLLLISLPFSMAYVFLGFDVLWGIDLFQQLSHSMVVFYSALSIAALALSVWLIKLQVHHQNYPDELVISSSTETCRF